MKADFFIVPNAAVKIEEKDMTGVLSVPESENDKQERFGIDPKFRIEKGDTIIQIWVTGEGSENWQDHGVPKVVPFKMKSDDGCKFRSSLFPEYLPKRCLDGLKEGDELHLNNNLIIVANQKGYRYGRFGSFHAVVAKLRTTTFV